MTNTLKTLLAVLILGLPLFYVFYKDAGSQKVNQLKTIDSVLVADVTAEIRYKKVVDSLKNIILQQDSIIKSHENRLKTFSKRTNFLRSRYDSIIIVRPKY